MKYIVKVYINNRVDDIYDCEYSGIVHDAHEEYLEAQIDTFEDPIVDKIFIQEV